MVIFYGFVIVDGKESLKLVVSNTANKNSLDPSVVDSIWLVDKSSNFASGRTKSRHISKTRRRRLSDDDEESETGKGKGGKGKGGSKGVSNSNSDVVDCTTEESGGKGKGGKGKGGKGKGGKGKGGSKGVIDDEDEDDGPDPEPQPESEPGRYLSDNIMDKNGKGKGGKGKGGKGKSGIKSPTPVPSSPPTLQECNENDVEDEEEEDNCPNGYSAVEGTEECAPDDCITITVNVEGFAELYAYCAAHEDPDDRCCSNDLASEGGTLDTVGAATTCVDWLFEEEVTVCKGSCVGSNACKSSKFLSGSRIGIHACRGREDGDGTENACSNIGLDDDVEAIVGTLATIDDNACEGYNACSNIKAETLSIGSASCVGLEACSKIAFEVPLNDGSPTSVTIGPGSCLGEEACLSLGEKAAENVIIGANACVSNGLDECGDDEFNACSYLGESAKDITIQASACDGSYVCNAIGQESAETITIAMSACRGTYACDSVGNAKATEVTINANACQGIDACEYLGETEATSVEILTGACSNGDRECEECGQSFVGAISLSDLGVGTDCNI